MRIAQITYSYKPIVGGADVYAARLHRLLLDDGHDACVYQRRRPTTGREVRALPPIPGVSPGGEFWLLPLFLPLYAPALLRHRALIVHYPNYWMPVLWHRRIIGLSHGVTWDDRPDSAASRFKKWLAKAAFRNCQAFVANDTFFLREMGLEVEPGKHLFEEVAPGRWFIPNTVDVGTFAPNEGVSALRELNPILVPRNIYRNRGLHLALEAYALFRREHPETTLVIVGDFSQPDYARELATQVRHLGLVGRAIFTGPVPYEEMPTIYGSGLMTVVPSVCGEGTSLAALESMSCGVPTVTTDVGGLADLPTNQAPAEIDALARAMLETFERRDEEGARQRKLVLSLFPEERWKETWLKVVQQVAG
ncbi:MAG: glycosyltransferase family 4 protein [Armatimonadota bacterium]